MWQYIMQYIMQYTIQSILHNLIIIYVLKTQMKYDISHAFLSIVFAYFNILKEYQVNTIQRPGTFEDIIVIFI